MTGVTLFPAGWALRQWTLEGLGALISLAQPSLVEVSKDWLSDSISLKDAARLFGDVRAKGTAVSFAGTTDLTSCAGFAWERYREYVAIQIAQARFLGCSLFRPFVGKPAVSTSETETVERVLTVCEDAAPMTVCIEIHGGVESDPRMLRELLERTPVKIIVDAQNAKRAGLTPSVIMEVVPPGRLAYFHQRNLPGVWTEDPSVVDDEAFWRERLPGAPFLWEPKTVDEPRRIQELFGEYRTSH